MEVLLPLHSKRENEGVKLFAPESSSAVIKSKIQTVVENGSDLLCINDGVSCTLFCLVQRELFALGTFFFRRTEHGGTLSVLANSEVKNFPNDGMAADAACDNSSVVSISAEGFLNFVDFVDDTLLLGTSSGCLGAVHVSTDRARIAGMSRRLQDSAPCEWCVSGCPKGVVCFSSSEIVVVAMERDAFCVTRYAGTLESISAASFSASWTMPNCFFLAHKDSHNLTVLHVSSRGIMEKDTVVLLPPSSLESSSFLSLKPSMQACDARGVSIQAVIYADAISFTSWDGHLLVSSTAFKNELRAPFGSSFWKSLECGARFFVIRADSRCLIYDVVIRETSFAMDEVVVVGQISLSSSMTCLMGDPYSGIFVSWNSGAQQARYTAQLQSVKDEEAADECIEVRYSSRLRLPDVSTVLLEIFPLRGTYGVVCLLSTGECNVALYNVDGMIPVAHEDHPYEATCCLVFEWDRQNLACVLGFSDGDVRVFVNCRLHTCVRAAHSGAVDKILKFSPMSETDDTLFVSVSTGMGTVCFHAGDTATVSRTMSAPSQPLTELHIDRELEYIFLLADCVGNLWHLPTCRLERAFRAQQWVRGRQADNLLEQHCTSVVSVVHLDIFDTKHYTLRVNVEALITGDRNAAQKSPRSYSSECCSVLALMLTSLGEPIPAILPKENPLSDALRELGMVVKSAATFESVWGTMLLLSEVLNGTTDSSSAASVYDSIESLASRLTACATTDSVRMADWVENFVSQFYTLQQPTPPSFRHVFHLLMLKIPLCTLRDLICLMKLRASAASTDSTEDRCAPFQPSPRLVNTRLVALIAVLNAITERTDYHLKDDGKLAVFLRESTTDVQRHVLSTFTDNNSPSRCSWMLLGLAESYAVQRALGEEENFQNFIRALVTRAFIDGCSEQQVLREALGRLVAQDRGGVLSSYIVETFDTHTECWHTVLLFLTFLVKNYSFEAYVAFESVATVIMNCLYRLSSVAKDLASIYLAEVWQLLRASASSLPSVSLQQSLQHLAIGKRDGSIAVYSLKIPSLVTTFQAHPSPVLGVAYSGNIASLDIATVAEAMDEVKVWRSTNESSAIASFFGGGNSTNFKLFATMAVSRTHHGAADFSLLINQVHLSWLSPQCVELSTPWHGKLQLSLP